MKKGIVGLIGIAACSILLGCPGLTGLGTPLIASKAITSFVFAVPPATGVVSEATRTIAISVPFGTAVSGLVPTIAHTGESLNPASGVATDFSDPVTYTVTAADSSTREYAVTVTVAPGDEKSFTSFGFIGTSATVTIDGAAHTVELTVPFGTDPGSLVAVFSVTGASVSVAGALQESGQTQNDFSTPLTYTITALDGSIQAYVVSVSINADPSSKSIETFGFSGYPEIEGIIDQASGTIDITLPRGGAIDALVAEFTTTGTGVRIGATAQVSGISANDFSAPLEYVVVAQDGSEKTFTVTVTLEPKTIVEFWHGLSYVNKATLETICADFNASQDLYTIVPTSKGGYAATMDAGVAAYLAGNPPAILQVYEVGTATMMANQGAVKPVHLLMSETGQVLDTTDFIPAIKSYYSSSDGDLLSLPFNVSTPVLYYNKDALAEADSALATAGFTDRLAPPATWPELYEFAKVLKTVRAAPGMTSTWTPWIQMENLSAMHDVPFATRSNGFDGLDTELSIDNELLRTHLSNLKAWSDEGVYLYGGPDNASNPNFKLGTVPILMESIGGYGGIKADCDFEVGVAPLPYYQSIVLPTPLNSIIGGASLWVMNGRPSPEYGAVAAFFKYLLLPETQYFFHSSTGYLPVTRAGYELALSQGLYTDFPGLEEAILQLLNGDLPPTANSRGIRLGNMTEIRGIFETEWQDILAENQDVGTGLADMQTRGNAVLRTFQSQYE